MKIKDLGQLDGPLLLFGGPYSNHQALRAVLGEAQQRHIPTGNMICTGDIVAYCADGHACVADFMRLGIPTIAGNCEIQLAAGAGDCGCGFETGTLCDVLSGNWYAHANQTITDNQRQFIGNLPDRIVFRHADLRFAVIHGGSTDVSNFIWPQSDADELRCEINNLEGQVGPLDCVIAGHCGMAFEQNVDRWRWLNAGAIGMPPHDGRAETRFATLHQGNLEFHELRYDYASAQKAMVSAGLTQGYHHALATGIWPSEDVLPDALKRFS